MYSSRVRSINNELKSHDPKLYIGKHTSGTWCVFRESKRVETYFIEELGSNVDFILPAPYLVFALTDDWTMRGNPVEWGILPIMRKLKHSDLWHRDVVGELLNAKEKYEEDQSKARISANETFMKEFRNDFKKTFADVNTATMDKSKDVRRKYEKRIKQ